MHSWATCLCPGILFSSSSRVSYYDCISVFQSSHLCVLLVTKCVSLPLATCHYFLWLAHVCIFVADIVVAAVVVFVVAAHILSLSLSLSLTVIRGFAEWGMGTRMRMRIRMFLLRVAVVFVFVFCYFSTSFIKLMRLLYTLMQGINIFALKSSSATPQCINILDQCRKPSLYMLAYFICLDLC